MSKAYFFLKDIDTSQIAGENRREAWMPKDGGYFDKSAREYFETKRQKRAWLATNGMREAELYNPNKGIGGTEGCVVKKGGRNA